MRQWPVYVINLRGDVQKWEAVSAPLTGVDWIRLKRVEAVYGSALPDNVCVRLTRDPYSVVAKGALGCMLSHVRAWELISKAEDNWAAVIEDDAVLGNIEVLRSYEVGDNHELLFCNHRTQPPDSANQSNDGPFLESAITRSLQSIDSRRQAVGTDGYLISRTGASKLVQLFGEHGYFGHVDMRMLAYSVDREEILSQLSESSRLVLELHAIQKVTGPKKRLVTSVLSPFLTHHKALGETSRTREDRLGLIGANRPGT